MAKIRDILEERCDNAVLQDNSMEEVLKRFEHREQKWFASDLITTTAFLACRATNEESVRVAGRFLMKDGLALLNYVAK
jgi:gluconate kinase